MSKLPPLPHWCEPGSPFAEQMQAYATAATEPLLQRIAELEANEKALLAQVQGLTKWREKIVKASEQAYGESAIRYKFSLTKSGKVMNTFPKEIDGRWFALVPAEDDGHIGHIARIAELERQLEEARSLLAISCNHHALIALRKDAERYRFIRDANRSSCIDGEIGMYAMESLDEYVDAAMEDEARIVRGAAMQKG